jgi:hypothetical protein
MARSIARRCIRQKRSKDSEWARTGSGLSALRISSSTWAQRKALADRWLVASDMLREIVKFWDRFFEQYGPKPNAAEKIVAGGK